VILLVFGYTAFLRVMSGLGGLEIVYVINIAEWLLLHLYRVYNGLRDYLLLLLGLGFDIKAFSL